MTWYADEIIALATPAALRAVSDDVRLAAFAYHVTAPLEHAWHAPEVEHGLPEMGLLVIRPVCDPADEDGSAAWYGAPVLDWSLFSGGAPLEIEPARVAHELAELVGALPPAPFLAHLKRLATTARTPLIYYSCCTFGGAPESEYAWAFGESERVLVGLSDDTGDAPRRIAILTRSEVTRVVPGDVLVSALAHVSLNLPTPYFAPHTRSFPWAKYALRRDV